MVSPSKKTPKRTYKKKTRRKRKGRYKTGIYRSKKCILPIKYRSSWEKEVCKFLDADPNVLEYGYECVSIPYISNLRTKKVRLYFPDFLVTYVNGTKKLIEVKRKDKLNDPKVLKKAEAAREWSKKQGIEYEFWTNQTILAIKKINEGNLKTKEKNKKTPIGKKKVSLKPKKK